MTTPKKPNRLRRTYARIRDAVVEFFAHLSLELLFNLLANLVVRLLTGVARLLGRAAASVFDGF